MVCLLAFLLGVSFFGTSSAVFNLLGETIQYPIIQWNGIDMVNFFGRKSYVWAKCRENGISHTELVKAVQPFYYCKTNYSLVIEPAQLEHLNTTSQCGAIEDFYTCMQSVSSTISNLCRFNPVMQAYTKNALQLNKVLMSLACEDDARRIRDFGRMGGSDCTSTDKNNLEACSDRNWSHDLLFDDNGCKKAWRFVTCVSKSLLKCAARKYKRNCNAEMADIPISMMAEALITTPCKHYCHENKYCRRYNRIMKYTYGSYVNSTATISKGSYAIGLGVATMLILI